VRTGGNYLVVGKLLHPPKLPKFRGKQSSLFLAACRQSPSQSCQIFRETIIPKPGKIYQMAICTIYPMAIQYTKWSYNIPNGRNIFRMAINYTIIFLSMALQNLPKVGFFGLKIYHLATLDSELDKCKFLNMKR
jgi:hypothetical protein